MLRDQIPIDTFINELPNSMPEQERGVIENVIKYAAINCRGQPSLAVEIAAEMLRGGSSLPKGMLELIDWSGYSGMGTIHI